MKLSDTEKKFYNFFHSCKNNFLNKLKSHIVFEVDFWISTRLFLVIVHDSIKKFLKYKSFRKYIKSGKYTIKIKRIFKYLLEKGFPENSVFFKLTGISRNLFFNIFYKSFLISH